MKGNLYLLRHESRNGNSNFATPLTPEGLSRAENELCDKLEELDIDTIYCSPFLRTIQTIYPFCKRKGLRVNIDWSLAESLPVNPDSFSEYRDIINNEYKSVREYNGPSKGLLSFDRLKGRTRSLLSVLEKDKNILLVTHLPVINAILYVSGRNKGIEMFTHHDFGQVVEI